MIISDDLDLKVGNFKLRSVGSSGGHNGLKNIEENLKTNEYKRIKIGIDRSEFIPVIDWVLKKFTKEELPVGTVIVIESGYQYRPDGWNTETTNTTGVRPGETQENIIHVDGNVDPIRDIEVINVELIMSDLEIIDNRINKIGKKVEENFRQNKYSRSSLSHILHGRCHISQKGIILDIRYPLPIECRCQLVLPVLRQVCLQ